MRTASVAALLALLAVATTGCGDGAPWVREFDGDPPIFTYHGDGEMEAIVSGRLVYLDDEQCIVLEEGGRHVVAVFPAGSDAYLESDGTLIVEMDGFGPLREDVSVTGGGGNVSAESPGIPDVPAGCSTDGISFAVLQRVSDAH